MPEFNYVNPMDGLIKGQDFVNGLFDHAATLQAGRAYQHGDVRGAAGLLASRGDFKSADVLNSQATTTDALTAANSGDYAGARAAAAKGGDAALYGQTTKAEEDDRAQRLSWMSNATDALLQVGAGLPPDQQQAKREAAFQQYIAPTLKAMQVPDEQIASINAGHFTDESLNGFKATIGQMGALDIQKTEDGTIVGIDKKTGAVKVLHQGQIKGVVAGPDLLNPYTGEVMHQGDRTKYMSVTNDDGTTSIVPVGGSGAGSPVASGAGGAAAPAPTGGAYDTMANLAEKKGATPEEQAYLRRTLKIESHGDPNAKNGSSTGSFQFHPDTFKSVLPNGNINDPGDQVQAAINLSRRDQARLQKLGVDPTPGNTYIMHQQGPAGGPALLTAPPEVNAITALTPAYGGNAKKARLAIVGNGGTEDMTAGEFVNHWRAQFGEGAGAAASAGAMGQPVATGSHSSTLRFKQLEDGRQLDTRTGHIEGTAVTAEEASFSPATFTRLAEQALANGGKFTPGTFSMGKSSNGMRVAAQNRLTEIAAARGLDGAGIVNSGLTRHADSLSLNKLTGTRDYVITKEKTAEKSMDLAVEAAAAGGGGTNFPLLNKMVIAGKRATGNTAADKYVNQLGAAVDEYSNVIGGGASNQAATDGVRAEARRRISEASSLPQLRAVLDGMRQDMAIRGGELSDGVEAIKGRLNGGHSYVGETTARAKSPLATPAQTTPAALRTYHQLGREGKYDYSAPIGSERHPYIASEAQANKLRKGSHVIIVGGAKDGSLVRVDD